MPKPAFMIQDGVIVVEIVPDETVPTALEVGTPITFGCRVPLGFGEELPIGTTGKVGYHDAANCYVSIDLDTTIPGFDDFIELQAENYALLRSINVGSMGLSLAKGDSVLLLTAGVKTLQ